jgi:hypothetical protein
MIVLPPTHGSFDVVLSHPISSPASLLELPPSITRVASHGFHGFQNDLGVLRRDETERGGKESNKERQTFYGDQKQLATGPFSTLVQEQGICVTFNNAIHLISAAALYKLG